MSGGQGRCAHAVELGAQALTPLANSSAPCFGAFAGYAFDTDLGARARLDVCTASSDNAVLTATAMNYGLAPDREALVPYVAVGGGAALDLGRRPVQRHRHRCRDAPATGR